MALEFIECLLSLHSSVATIPNGFAIKGEFQKNSDIPKNNGTKHPSSGRTQRVQWGIPVYCISFRVCFDTQTLDVMTELKNTADKLRTKNKNNQTKNTKFNPSPKKKTNEIRVKVQPIFF